MHERIYVFMLYVCLVPEREEGIGPLELELQKVRRNLVDAGSSMRATSALTTLLLFPFATLTCLSFNTANLFLL